MTLYLFIAAALAAAPARAADVQWGRVTAGGYTSVLKVPGHVIAQEGALSIESARIQGRITKILKREGETLAAGAPLFAVNGPECVSLAQEKAVASGKGLQDLIDAAKRREEQLGLRVSDAECLVLASHAGVLTKRQVELGAAFNVGDALATVLDVDSLGIELDVPERNLSQVKEGEPARVQLAANPEKTLRARVEHLLPTIDATTRSGKARLAPVALPPGTTLDALVFAEIDTGVAQQAFKVPTAALVFSRNKQYVVKRSGKDSVAVPVDVVGESDSVSTVRASDGGALRAGDEVAVKGAIFLLRRLLDI